MTKKQKLPIICDKIIGNFCLEKATLYGVVWADEPPALQSIRTL
jgi:hypothetical protein